MLNKKKNNKGFTLVELLVVIAIIGILAVVAVPALFSNIKKAKIADLEADYSAYKSAALSYYSDENEDTKLATSPSNLDSYMESRPERDPFGGTYRIEGGGANNLVLVAPLDGTALKGKELEKIQKDLGAAVIPYGDGSYQTGIKLTLIKK